MNDLSSQIERAGFTKGPWYVRDLRASELKRLGWDGEFIDRILISNKDGAGIVECEGQDCIIARISFDNRPDDELLGPSNLADARLIAAAPDMFEALKLADAILSNTPEFSTTNTGRIPVTKVSEAREIVRAALLRALISQKEGVE